MHTALEICVTFRLVVINILALLRENLKNAYQRTTSLSGE